MPEMNITKSQDQLSGLAGLHPTRERLTLAMTDIQAGDLFVNTQFRAVVLGVPTEAFNFPMDWMKVGGKVNPGLLCFVELVASGDTLLQVINDTALPQATSDYKPRKDAPKLAADLLDKARERISAPNFEKLFGDGCGGLSRQFTKAALLNSIAGLQKTP